MRFLLLTLLVFLAIWLIRQLLDKPKRQQPQQAKVVPCAYCGVHLPQAEAIARNEHFFCSEAHYNEWQSNQ